MVGVSLLITGDLTRPFRMKVGKYQICAICCMLMIIHQRPKRFVVADLTSGFFKCHYMKTVVDTPFSFLFGGFTNGLESPRAYFPVRSTYRKAWVLTFRVIYFIRYAKFILTTWLLWVLMIITSLQYVCAVFQRCREKNVTLNSK